VDCGRREHVREYDCFNGWTGLSVSKGGQKSEKAGGEEKDNLKDLIPVSRSTKLKGRMKDYSQGVRKGEAMIRVIQDALRLSENATGEDSKRETRGERRKRTRLLDGESIVPRHKGGFL